MFGGHGALAKPLYTSDTLLAYHTRRSRKVNAQISIV